MAAIFASEVGPCVGIVEPFKHVLCVTAHPKIFAFELRAPMGAYPGQYGISISYIPYRLAISPLKQQNRLAMVIVHAGKFSTAVLIYH